MPDGVAQFRDDIYNRDGISQVRGYQLLTVWPSGDI
jgi:murein L,D-transpeptidase YcbB/YkuD